MEDTLEGKYVVCRICEGVIQEEHLASHSSQCSEVALSRRRWETSNDFAKTLIVKLRDSLTELTEAKRKPSVPASALESLRALLAALKRESVDEIEKFPLDSVKNLNQLEVTLTFIEVLKNTLDEKRKAAQAVRETIELLERSPHAAVGSLFRSKPNEGASSGDSVRGQVPGPSRPSIHDFNIIKPISRGSFGSVLLGRKKTTGDIYAIKVVKKQALVEKNQINFIANERNILAFTNNPFVVKLYYSFQSANNLYMVMEFLPGGDCFSLLRNLTCFPEKLARHYIAELVQALSYLHANGIIHRDLKPDNLLIGADGHLKLTDFGLSQMGLLDRKEGAYEWRKVGSMMEAGQQVDSCCVGTPDYLAPEIFLGMGHGPEVDWWAVGCITYEFLVGITPFYADTFEAIFANIVSNTIIWPDGDEKLPPETVDFITKLLMTEPSDRLGAKGADEVKAHPWFAGVDWANLRDTKSPFIPKLSQSEDTFYFEPRNSLYPTTWEGDAEGKPEEEPLSRLRNFSIVNIPHLMTLNENLVNQGPGH